MRKILKNMSLRRLIDSLETADKGRDRLDWAWDKWSNYFSSEKNKEDKCLTKSGEHDVKRRT